MKTKSVLAVACMLAVAIIATLGVSTEAFAALPHAHGAVAGFGEMITSYSPHIATIGLAAMRANLAELVTRADAKAAEAKDGLDAKELRKIEDEHASMVKDIEKLKEEIATEERREADDAARRNQPTPTTDDAAIRAAATAAAAEATRAERTRTTTIRSLAAQAGVPALGETHAAQDTSIDQFRSLLLDHLVSAEGQQVRSATRVQVGQSNHEQRAAAIHNALMHRASPGSVELTADGRNFRGMTLLEIGRDVLEINGVNTRGMTRIEIAAQALMQRSAGGLHSTSDFGGILANVANTTLRAAYEAAPQTFRPLVRETSVSDFKTVTRAQLGEAPALNKVSEHGEFKRGSLGEGKESYKIATYGKIVGITRQVIINDDLDAFSRLPAAFGVQAAQLESDLVWAQILANPTMGDGKTLFHADHGNIFTPAATISVDTMSAGRVAFSKQTGLDGKTILGLTPRYVIVPIALQTKAEQLKGQIYAAKNTDVVPESMKAFEIIAEARLDVGINRPDDDIVASGSATAWYLAGSIAQNDIIELAYLDGNRGVYTETRTGFDIDGVEVKARLDVGAKVIEHRNIAKNAGA